MPICLNCPAAAQRLDAIAFLLYPANHHQRSLAAFPPIPIPDPERRFLG
jgi:hypothetical protein